MIQATLLPELTEGNGNWLYKTASNGKNLIPIHACNTLGILPFIPVLILRNDENHSCYVKQLGLIDSGSNQCLVNQSFLKKSFPKLGLKRSNISLQLISSPINVDVLYTTKLLIFLSIWRKRNRDLLWFFSSPKSCNKLNLRVSIVSR